MTGADGTVDLMLSDDEAAVFDRLVGELESDPGFAARTTPDVGRELRRRVGYVAVAGVAIALATVLLAVPGGPYTAMVAFLGALWSLHRATRRSGLDPVYQELRARIGADGVAWRSGPSR